MAHWEVTQDQMERILAELPLVQNFDFKDLSADSLRFTQIHEDTGRNEPESRFAEFYDPSGLGPLAVECYTLRDERMGPPEWEPLVAYGPDLEENARIQRRLIDIFQMTAVRRIMRFHRVDEDDIEIDAAAVKAAREV